jgi:hypothetical protein
MSALKGFRIGDETVEDVLRPEQTSGECVACHTATPDGLFLATGVTPSIDSGDPSHIELRASDGSGRLPEYVTNHASALLAREPQHMPTFSKQHYSPGNRVLVSLLDLELIWTDLEAVSQAEGSGWGVLARAGDPNLFATHPAFNNSGTSIVYTSAGEGQLTKANATDLYIVPYADRRGGTAVPVPGASSPDANEFYAAYSPDDALLIFNKAPVAGGNQTALPFTSDTTYNNPLAELHVVSATGGVPQRLIANDPPACSGKQSPGVSNSWGKWSPNAQTISGRTHYWLTFSSTRVDPLRPQLFVTPVIVDAGGQLSTHPALYLWNQPEDEGNHTPAWGSSK